MYRLEELLIYCLTMGSASCATLACYPGLFQLGGRLASWLERIQQAKANTLTEFLDDLFVAVKPTRIKAAYVLAPLIMGGLALLYLRNLLAALGAAAVGLLLPDLWVKQMKLMRRRKFQAQLVDALFVLSSSLRAGLSLTQAFEQLESELPPPASQEFGLMIKAHRLGQSLEHALRDLNERMPSEELTLITTAILVAHETGGDVTRIIEQLVTTIREKKKLNEKVKTLTMQGKLQAYILSALPLLFFLFVRASSPNYFKLLLQDRLGHMLILIAAVLWVVGMALLVRLSKVEV